MSTIIRVVTGDHVGESGESCKHCDTTTHGQRWQLIVMIQRTTHAPELKPQGVVCESCFEHFNK